MTIPTIIRFVARLAAMLAAGTTLIAADAALAKGRGVANTAPTRVKATPAPATATGPSAASAGHSIVSPPPNAVSIPNVRGHGRSPHWPSSSTSTTSQY
jgi:hypothetical protein